jgi:hypothetical protein
MNSLEASGLMDAISSEVVWIVSGLSRSCRWTVWSAVNGRNLPKWNPARAIRDEPQFDP